jgi:cytosine/adenosine deaminase-related metal-dependent hydrolase
VIERVLYGADVVYNGIGLPTPDGGVVVSRGFETETVVAFGRLEELGRQFQDAQLQHLGRAILPRPVNAHTHLDLTRVPFRALPYFDWIPGVVLANLHLRGLEAARVGLEMTSASGVGAFGDIVARPEVMDYLLTESDVPGVAYWEVLAPDPAQADEVFKDTVERVRVWRTLERPGMVRVGLTPHTPFTVSAKLMTMICEFARLEGLPLQIHVSEHPTEPELFRTGAGPLADAMRGLVRVPFDAVWNRTPDPALTPVKFMAELGVLEARPTLIHMVNVTEEDVKIVAQSGCTVVSCPRSNRNLECGDLPWQLYARYGVEVGLGTDSIASGQSLSIQDEAKAALEVHGEALGLRNVVRWAVKGGYRALGMKPPVVQRGDPFSSLVVWT